MRVEFAFVQGCKALMLGASDVTGCPQSNKSYQGECVTVFEAVLDGILDGDHEFDVKIIDLIRL